MSRQNTRSAVYESGHVEAPAPDEASILKMLTRVYSEYTNTPGLRLTSKRAQTLWGLDESTCMYVLSLLVDAKFLCRFGDDYGRATSDPALVTVARSRVAGVSGPATG